MTLTLKSTHDSADLGDSLLLLDEVVLALMCRFFRQAWCCATIM